MPTKITSFGFRHGHPDVIAGVMYIDIRTGFSRNPFHDKKLRKLRGTDWDVQLDIMKTPNFDSSYEKLKAIVAAHPGPVWLGCTGGHHRSVYLAERIGGELGVMVFHRDISRK